MIRKAGTFREITLAFVLCLLIIGLVLGHVCFLVYTKQCEETAFSELGDLLQYVDTQCAGYNFLERQLPKDIGTSVQERVSMRVLLKGFNMTKATVAVEENGVIAASNDETLISERASDCSAIRQLVANGKPGELIKTNDTKETYYGAYEYLDDKAIYIFRDGVSVLAPRTEKLIDVAGLYLVFCGCACAIYFSVMFSKEQKQAERDARYNREVDSLAKKAVLADRAKMDFLCRMSHDIKTPIAGIQGLIRIAEYYADDPEKQRECRKKALDASTHLLDLVNDILDVSKLDAGEATWKDEPFDMEKLLSGVYAMMSAQAEEHNVTLHFSGEDIRNPQLYGGAVALKRICLNLIGNAIKYNRENGTVDFSVRQIGYDEAAGTAKFEFVCRDTGIGMSEEFLAKMYEPFMQEDLSYRSSLDGSGLGLAIVRRLVDRMGGEIGAVSRKGEGTEFTWTLSFRVETDQPLITKMPDAASGNASAEPSLTGVNILLVEDNKLNMEIAQFVLETAGANVSKAANGKEAVEVFERSGVGEIRLILMDLMMPVMDGIESAKAIRALDRPDASTVPIIAMTANAYSDDVERVLRAGMNAHLAKPVDMEKLLRTIDQYL